MLILATLLSSAQIFDFFIQWDRRIIEVAYVLSILQLQDIKFTCKRKGGNLNRSLSHDEWSQTVQLEPDVISMSFIPISSLLSGLHGSGFLSHAINLYLRCKYEPRSVCAFISFVQYLEHFLGSCSRMLLNPLMSESFNEDL